MNSLYSLTNAQKFNWSSVSGDLNPERVSHLETYLAGNKILDAGCGGGAYVEFLSRKGLEVTGIDKHKQFLRVAKEQSRIGTYVQCDITKLNFLDKTFDCTYCFDVLEHVDDKLAIQELARVTTSRLIIAVPKEDEIMHEFNLTFLHYQDKTHLRNYSEQSLRELVTTINYSKLSIFPELQVPARFLVKKMILWHGLHSKQNSISNKLTTLILPKLLNKASYQKIFTGLVAIVDLQED
ncbi:class I SAM-dependent methyltransferase [Pleurocapsales cyanobacterium LEGE 10410]|nr:class I SAM-dependent methyltransferase [Pleurocapsales cyanobacterium LEGE 10410]